MVVPVDFIVPFLFVGELVFVCELLGAAKEEATTRKLTLIIM